MPTEIFIKNSLRSSLLSFLKTNKKNKKLNMFTKRILTILENKGSVVLKNFFIANNNNNNLKNFEKFMNLFGKVLQQNRRRERIVKIQDLGKHWSAKTRGYKTNDYLDFHTDGGALASLFCINSASYGGASTYVEVKKIYDLIKDKDLKKKLFEGFKYHTRNESLDNKIITKRKYPIFFF